MRSHPKISAVDLKVWGASVAPGMIVLRLSTTCSAQMSQVVVSNACSSVTTEPAEQQLPGVSLYQDGPVRPKAVCV